MSRDTKRTNIAGIVSGIAGLIAVLLFLAAFEMAPTLVHDGPRAYGNEVSDALFGAAIVLLIPAIACGIIAIVQHINSQK